MSNLLNKSKFYTCQSCQGTFEKEWSDEEAMEESKELFGNIPKEELALICHDCFKKIEPKWATLC